MFSGSGLFKKVPCPDGPEKCRLANCIFSHEPNTQIALSKAEDATSDRTTAPKPHDDLDEFGRQKRRKLDDKTNLDHVSVPQFGAAFFGLPVPKPQANGTSKTSLSSTNPAKIPTPSSNGSHQTLASAMRPISPPPAGSHDKRTAEKASIPLAAKKPETSRKMEKLNPRSVPKDPAPHMQRYALLQKLHEAIGRLNEEIAVSTDKGTRALYLDSQALITAALDEEEDYARGKSSVYLNVVKLRIAAYKKMKLEEWKGIRLKKVEMAEEGEKPKVDKLSPPQPISLETELSAAQQLLMLKRFLLKPQDMQNAKFIVVPPSDAEIEEAKKIIKVSINYEKCDRCGTRFQVFPDRREEDGALTTGGTCQHHWGKLRKQGKTSGYTCCNEAVGTLGCTMGETHVFKINSPGRLASVLQFQPTPENTKALEGVAVAFDCEMAWTCHGLEIIRLSATTWPDNKVLIDVLVRPVGQILDLNTVFSGITPEMYFNAEEHDQPQIDESTLLPNQDGTAKPSSRLRIMSSPAAARSLFWSYISPDTILIGHSIDNDLNVLRLVHPKIVDTSLLYNHPAGLPYRYGLKNLVKQFLQRDVQTGGTDGHDSLEDSRGTGDLVKWKVAAEWTILKEQGWYIKDGKFMKKDDKGRDDVEKDLPPYLKNQSLMSTPRKRRAD